METLLTESMGSGFFLSRFYREACSGPAGNFRQNGTQLELIEYHAGLRRRSWMAVIRLPRSMDRPRSPKDHRNAKHYVSPVWRGGRERFQRSSCRAVHGEDGPEVFAKPLRRQLAARNQSRKERCDGRIRQAIPRSLGCIWFDVFLTASAASRSIFQGL